MFQSISGMFGGGGGSGLFGGLLSIFGFANGGLISGPGTGTSDSILARVSNKEFIVNAKQTAKYLPLLQAINSNTLPKFAEGGLPGSTLGALPTFSNIETPSVNNKSSQIINIEITGDISRQTKSTIYEMLPDIANGVNVYNREMGYRG
jgi:hypothetical protein